MTNEPNTVTIDREEFIKALGFLWALFGIVHYADVNWSPEDKRYLGAFCDRWSEIAKSFAEKPS